MSARRIRGNEARGSRSALWWEATERPPPGLDEVTAGATRRPVSKKPAPFEVERLGSFSLRLFDLPLQQRGEIWDEEGKRFHTGRPGSVNPLTMVGRWGGGGSALDSHYVALAIMLMVPEEAFHSH